MQLPYLPPLLPLLLLLVLPFSHQFWGFVFLFFFSAIPAIVLFSPSPLMMIITYYLPVHIRLFFLFFFSFFLCRVVVPDDVFHQNLSRKASKQTAIRNHCLLARLLARLVRFSFFLT